MLLNGEDKAAGFRQRVEALTAKGVLPGDWTYDAQRPITRGRLAYMVCRACDLRGGVILSLTGPSQRYCLRELQYMGMVSGTTVWGQPNGMEFVAILTRADTYRRTGELPAIMEMPKEGQ